MRNKWLMTIVIPLCLLTSCQHVEHESKGTDPITAMHNKANAGDAAAQCDLGDCYSEGRNVPQNDTEAFQWYRMAAEQGDAYGQYAVGKCYAKGIGVMKDDAAAVNWFRKSAGQAFTRRTHSTSVR